MKLCDLEARLRRLLELERGLTAESVLLAKGDDPLLYLERRAYLITRHNAVGGITDARLALATACQRLRPKAG